MKTIPIDLMIKILTRQITAYRVFILNSASSDDIVAYSKKLNRLRAKKNRLQLCR